MLTICTQVHWLPRLLKSAHEPRGQRRKHTEANTGLFIPSQHHVPLITSCQPGPGGRHVPAHSSLCEGAQSGLCNCKRPPRSTTSPLVLLPHTRKLRNWSFIRTASSQQPAQDSSPDQTIGWCTVAPTQVKLHLQTPQSCCQLTCQRVLLETQRIIKGAWQAEKTRLRKQAK